MAGTLGAVCRGNFPPLRGHLINPQYIPSQSLKPSSICKFLGNPYRRICFLAPRMAETQNHDHETTEPSPKIPKLEHDCLWEDPIPEITSFFRVKKLSEKAIVPSRASFLSAGYDLSSAADITVPAKGKALIPTDLSIAVPEGTYARIAPRSGLTWKRSIDVGAGVIDADYRGPVGVILFNHSDVDFEVKMGDRIAQLIIQKIINPEFMMSLPSQILSPPPPLIMPSSESRQTSVGASGSNREPTTPISMLGSQFPPHSAEFEIENINLEHNEEDVKEPKASRNRVKVVWSTDEEKCLARALSTISNDPKVGNAQKNRHFWQSITTYYNDNRPVGTSAREWTAIKPHYYQIMPDVGKFSGWYNNFFNNRINDESDADVLAATHDMWKKMHKNKAFKYEHVWKIMTECEKLTIQSLGGHADKKTRTSESRAHTSSTNPDIDDDSEIHSQPKGQQRTKINNKVKVIEDEGVNEKWIQMQQYQKEKLALKEAEIKQKEIELKQAEIKQKEIELKQRDYDILMKDTSGMTETQFHWHMKIVEEIAERRDLK